MKSLQQSQQNLEELFSYFNDKLYNGELETPVITIQSDVKNNCYGWCTTQKIWETQDGEEYYEINICAEYLSRSFEEICGTLIHEMAHLFNLMNNVVDCNAGQYHNKKYKDAAEAHGLIVEKTKHGWSKTTINDSVKEMIAGFDKDFKFDITRKPRMKKTAPKKRPTLKYVCPACGCKIYSLYPLNVHCNDCDEDFEQYQ